MLERRVQVRILFRVPAPACPPEWAQRLITRVSRLAFLTTDAGTTYLALVS